MSKRKQHHPEFTAKVALEALKGEETVSAWRTSDDDPSVEAGFACRRV